MRRGIAAAALGLLVAACGADPSGQVVSATAEPPVATLRRCSEVRLPSAPAEHYRETPMYVGNEMPVEAVMAWASDKPGFVSLWIDREHNGWVAVSFSEDAEERHTELTELFPDEGVVAVPVDWTEQSLREVEAGVIEDLAGVVEVLGTSADVERGVIGIYVDVLTKETLDAISGRVDVEQVCVDGLEPEDQVPPGPQPLEGDGWRLLLDADETGMVYEVGIAWDQTSLDEQLAHHLVGADVDVDVAFESEVVLIFGAVHGSSCPNLRLDDVVVAGSAVYPVIVNTDNAMACTADAIGHLYVVSLERGRLPGPPFTVHLSEPDPETSFDLGAIVVSADLRAPASVAAPGDVSLVPEQTDAGAARSGDTIEVGYPRQYRLDLSCGLESLGELNSYSWVAGEPIPATWTNAAEGQQYLMVEILLSEGPSPTIDMTYLGETVTYLVGEPGC